MDKLKELELENLMVKAVFKRMSELDISPLTHTAILNVDLDTISCIKVTKTYLHMVKDQADVGKVAIFKSDTVQSYLTVKDKLVKQLFDKREYGMSFYSPTEQYRLSMELADGKGLDSRLYNRILIKIMNGLSPIDLINYIDA